MSEKCLIVAVEEGQEAIQIPHCMHFLKFLMSFFPRFMSGGASQYEQGDHSVLPVYQCSRLGQQVLPVRL